VSARRTPTQLHGEIHKLKSALRAEKASHQTTIRRLGAANERAAIAETKAAAYERAFDALAGQGGKET
jgi:uncharacterized protein YqeY